jgi:hypothetical protein
MKSNVSVVRLIVATRSISGKIIKEIPGSVARGTHCIRIIRRMCLYVSVCLCGEINLLDKEN